MKRAVADFLEAAANELGIQAEARTEVREIVGRPDVGILIGGLLCGHLETKAPGHTVNPRQFRGHDRTQWQKFQRLPNLIYTNGHEWRLYREGDAVGEVIRLDGDPAEVGADAVSEQNAQDLAQLLLAYYRWKPIVPNDPPGLARFLAPLTRLLRDDVHEALVRNAETLIGLRDELRAFLMPELTDDQFADAYAQTLTYAMLLARLDGAEDLSPRAAARTLRARNTLLERLLEILGQEEAYDDVRLGLEVLQRAIGAIDAASLRRPGRDLWLYFYENFLHAYDPDLARDYGVYYTPAQIVHCQVRLVSQLLRERFQRRFSFADEDVITLDPGAGTGTYLVETSRSIIWVLRKARNY
ncbi:MAG TPA: N-6 DNA methylase [Methyloceanibacter sp.]|nr:N-6 DNA methylase [Methyloceanibacter sp.]